MTFYLIVVQQDESVWDSIIANLPRDPATIFVLVLLVFSVGAIWMANRKKD